MNKVQSTVIECRQVSKVFDEAGLRTEVLKAINFSIRPGEQLAIIGSSGAGKSTLLHILGGLEQPSSGEVFLHEKSLRKMSETERCRIRNRDLGFVYQFHHLLPEFSVLENVAMPLLIQKALPETAEQEARMILERVGLGHRLEHRLGELSGGERQRAAIARALVTKPRCLLADEPTGNLDAKTAEQVYQTLLSLNREFSTSLIIVTHDHKLAARMDRIFELVDGELKAVG